MKKSIAVLITLLAVLVVAGPAGALTRGAEQASKAQSAGVTGIRAGVTCHDPCDDPFQLKAWVKGSGISGLTVKWVVDGKTFRAKTSSTGFAHYHLKIRRSSYPQGVKFTVKASVTKGGTTKSGSTWFKPNYN